MARAHGAGRALDFQLVDAADGDRLARMGPRVPPHARAGLRHAQRLQRLAPQAVQRGEHELQVRIEHVAIHHHRSPAGQQHLKHRRQAGGRTGGPGLEPFVGAQGSVGHSSPRRVGEAPHDTRRPMEILPG
ncbi:hypothetical protein D3C78_1561960 [compost metagenome]